MAVYYVSSAGNDSNNGTSTGTSWLTIGKVNSATTTNDVIHFNGGDTFTDATLTVKSGQTVDSYGSGRATVSRSGTNDGIYGNNVVSPVMDNLIVVGSNGIRIQNSGGGSTKLAGPEIKNCDVTGSGANDSTHGRGIYFDAVSGTSGGWTGTKIHGNEVHDCTVDGIVFSQDLDAVYKNSGTLVYDNEVHDVDWSLGIYVQGDDGAPQMYGNEVYNVGALNMDVNGPAGTIFVACKNGVMYNNICHDIKTGNSSDGIGIDLDGACVDCIMEYNLTYHCDGSGILLFGANLYGPDSYSGNIARFNISIDDSQDTSQAPIRLTTNGTNCLVYNNTVIQSTGGGGIIGGLSVDSDGAGGWAIYNNIICVPDNIYSVHIDSTHVVAMEGNNYCTAGNFYAFDTTGSTTYTNIATFRTATGFENAGGIPRGNSYFPMFQSPQGTIPTGLGTDDCQLSPQSPLNATGLNLLALFGINPGSTDYLGNTLRASYSVGACDAPGAGYGETNLPLIIFSDNFHRANAGSFGNNWSDPDGYGSIVSNQGVVTYTGSGGAFIYRPSGENYLNSRVVATTDNTVADSQQRRIGLRFSNGLQNFWQLIYDPDVTNTTLIVRVINGSGTAISPATVSVTTGHVYQLMLEAISSSPTFLRGEIFDITAGTTVYDTGFISENTAGVQVAGQTAIGAASTGVGVIFASYASYNLAATSIALQAANDSYAQSSTLNISLTGTGTFWTNTVPSFTVSGGTLNSTTIVNDTKASLNVTTGAGSVMLISDGTSNLVIALQLTAGGVVNGAGMFLVL